MNRFGLAALASAVLVAGAVTLAPAAPAPTVVTLRNGLRVVLAPDSAALAVDVGVWYPAGIRWEGRGQSGLSHLCTRLMFRGSAGVPDGGHLKQLQAEGATVNTTNTADGTCFWQTLVPEALPLALRLEADRMGGLVGTPQAFEAARADARADRRARAEATPIARGLVRLLATAFPGSGYGRPLYGDDGDLQRLTARDAQAWQRAHYGAGSAVLTITGRFAPEATLAYVRSLFEALPKGAVAGAVREPAIPATEQRAWTRGATPLRIVYAGWRAPGTTDPDAPAVEMLATVLGEDMSAFRAAMTGTWNVAVVTQSRAEMHQDASLLWVAAALTAEADSSTAERVMLDEVSRLAREPLAPEVLERTRARLLTDLLFGSQAVHARGFALGQAVFETGDAGAAERRIAAIEKLTAADLQRVAQRILTAGNRAVSWYVPAGEGR